MRFECYQDTNEKYRAFVDEIHNINEQYGANWGVVSRMWITKEDKTVMIEHQVMTAKGKENFESPNEPDWLGAYVVDDEEDDDCSHPIDMREINPDATLEEVKMTMEKFANELLKEKGE